MIPSGRIVLAGETLPGALWGCGVIELRRSGMTTGNGKGMWLNLVGAGDDAGRTVDLAGSGLTSGGLFSLNRPWCNLLVRRFPISCGS